jgi:flagellar basal-body rod modification protein FlgD
MTAAPVNATSGASASGSISSAYGSAQEQKDMFLQLLVAQLKNQDPSSPMDQKDLMGQMAQFTSVEQLTNMVSSMEKLSFNTTFSQSVGLIGKTVDYASTTPDGATSIHTSTVAAVNSGAGKIGLVLEDGRTIEPGDIVRVSVSA